MTATVQPTTSRDTQLRDVEALLSALRARGRRGLGRPGLTRAIREAALADLGWDIGADLANRKYVFALDRLRRDGRSGEIVTLGNGRGGVTTYLDEADVPPGWGLLVARGRGLTQVRAAEALRDLTPEIVDGRHVRPLPPGFTRGFLVSLLRNGTARAKATPEEIAAAHHAGRETRTHEVERHKALYDSLYAKVQEFQEASGIVIGRHGFGEHEKGPREIGAAVRAVLAGDADTERIEGRLRRLLTDAEAIAETARQQLAGLEVAA